MTIEQKNCKNFLCKLHIYKQGQHHQVKILFAVYVLIVK